MNEYNGGEGTKNDDCNGWRISGESVSVEKE
jgi:hypothetical protein